MEQDKKIKIIIGVATGVGLLTIAGVLIYLLRKGKPAMGVEQIMAQLHD